MGRAEDLRRKILSQIEENRNEWVKAAFYSDPEVERIMARLVREWEARGMRGEPLDYATLEELEVMGERADRYVNSSREEFLRRMLRRSIGAEGEKGL